VDDIVKLPTDTSSPGVILEHQMVPNGAFPGWTVNNTRADAGMCIFGTVNVAPAPKVITPLGGVFGAACGFPDCLLAWTIFGNGGGFMTILG
jgi:hypothetical protein